VFNWPLPSQQQLADYYQRHYRLQYKGVSQPKLKHHYRYARRIIDQVRANPEPYHTAHTVLDVGAGSGEFCALMQQLGKQVTALEPTTSYADYMRQRFGLEVHNGMLQDFSTEQRFDLVRISHVLEHMRDPVAVLIQLRGLLSEGGLLLVEVPDFRDYCRSKSRGNIFHFGHIFNFDSTTLTLVAALAGFEVAYRSSATSLYLRPCKPRSITTDPRNAERNFAAFSAHLGSQGDRPSRLAKLKGKLQRLLAERRALRHFHSPQHIIERLAKDIQPLIQR